MNVQTCYRCKKSQDINGVLICLLTNQSVNIIELCPKLMYQFSNQYDFARVIE